MLLAVPLFLLIQTSPPVQEIAAILPGLRFSQPLNYPLRAQERGLSGNVVLSCAVQEGGLLGDCAVLSESTAGIGFGPAAVRSASGGQLGVDASEAYAGRRISFSVQFRIAPEPVVEADEGP